MFDQIIKYAVGNAVKKEKEFLFPLESVMETTEINRIREIFPNYKIGLNYKYGPEKEEILLGLLFIEKEPEYLKNYR